jgi:hypothetical protein
VAPPAATLPAAPMAPAVPLLPALLVGRPPLPVALLPPLDALPPALLPLPSHSGSAGCGLMHPEASHFSVEQALGPPVV